MRYVNDGGMTDLIAEYETHMRSMGTFDFSDATIESRIRLLRQIDHDLDPYGLTSASPETIVGWFKTEWKSWTVATYQNHIVAFFAWACDSNVQYLDMNPAIDLVRPKTPTGIPNPLLDEEVDRALTLLPEPWKLAVKLACFAGLRCVEIARSKREHFTETTLTVQGKGGYVDVLPTHPILWEAVKDLAPGFLLSQEDGSPVDRHYVSRMGRYYLHEIGVMGSMHRGRHWFGTHVYRTTKDWRLTQSLMRHRSSRSTEGYTKIFDEDKVAAIAGLSAPVQFPSAVALR